MFLLLQGSEMIADKVDMKEGIYFGPDCSDDPDVTPSNPLMGANQFPDENDLPGFAATIKSYMKNMSSVG